jgi:hypothetical protein
MKRFPSAVPLHNTGQTDAGGAFPHALHECRYVYAKCLAESGFNNGLGNTGAGANCICYNVVSTYAASEAGLGRCRPGEALPRA